METRNWSGRSPQRARPPPKPTIENTADTDQTAASLQQPRSLGQSGRVSADDAPASSLESAGRAVGGGAAREVETEAGSGAARAATTAATVGGEEAAGGVLDAIPGLDILGLALGAIGGITSAVAGATPSTPAPAPKLPKAMSIGGNFGQEAVEAGGTTA